MRKMAADVLIVRHGKILMLKRNTEPFLGYWCLPGGHLEGDETIEETARREAKEETGLDVKLESLIGVFSDPKRDPRKTISVAFSATVAEGEAKINEESTDLRWFDITRLPKKIASDHLEIIKKYFGYG